MISINLNDQWTTQFIQISMSHHIFPVLRRTWEHQDSAQVETDRISKYVLEIKDVLEFKDART